MTQRTVVITRNVIILIIILLLILAGCYYRNQVQNTRDEYFMDKELIIAGSTADINDLISQLQAIDPGIILTLDPNRSFPNQDTEIQEDTQQIESSILSLQALALAGEIPSCEQFSQDYQINLYELSGSNDDIEAVLAAIDETEAGGRVVAEANWVIGAPWSPTGSPWSPTGSTDEGKPTAATRADYQEQWAFERIALAAARQEQQNIENPERVWIGVFDTSPLESGENADIESTPNERPEENDLNIEISHPPFVATPVPPRKGSPEDIQVANHGYFGATFIRELAPGSEIILVRVLTKNNRGDLATLNTQLLTFMGEVQQASANAQGEDIKAVINLSLGVPPLEPFQPFAPLLPWKFPVPFELARRLQTLQIVAQIGECLDVVMVAAAGNNSAESLKVSNFPANWGTVLGVTASNMDYQRSCYANEGDVAAPGGDGTAPGDNEDICKPQLNLCSNVGNGLGPNCPYSVIGFVHRRSQGLEILETERYHHWVGTSFATPMVSGLAALVRQIHPSLSAAQVRQVILCGTREPERPQEVRVINVEKTLACANSAAEQNTVE